MGQLTYRIDAGRTEPAPPKRRYRLVLDAHADTRDDLDALLTQLSFAVHDDSLTDRTSGGPSDGYHVEITDHGADVTHDSYVAALTAWRMEKHGIPKGIEP